MSTVSRGHRRARRVEPQSALFGVCCLSLAAALAYLAFATPLLDRLAAGNPLDPARGITQTMIWAIALIAPAGLALVGVMRLADAADALFARSPAGPVRSLGRLVGESNHVFGPIRLPDGRLIPELVIGAHGVAIFEVMPPRGATRQHAHSWEVRLPNGRWMPIENPLDQAARDAERVRRWLATDDRDFVIKVHAAVIAPDQTIPRTSACAVITRDQVPAFLASLPGQRTLTEGRLKGLLEVVRAAS